MNSSETDQEFHKALGKARLMISKKLLTNVEVCELYGIFQQATIGDCNDWKVFRNLSSFMLDLDSKSKFKAWQANFGLNPMEAKQKYSRTVDLLGTKYSVVFPKSCASRFGSMASLATYTTNLTDDTMSISSGYSSTTRCTSPTLSLLN